jgi:hypothetical protein
MHTLTKIASMCILKITTMPQLVLQQVEDVVVDAVQNITLGCAADHGAAHGGEHMGDKLPLAVTQVMPLGEVN